ncbi:lysozyme family protein [Metabacillus hrfriensis]|uniref:Lysozyme family protein n=1 Tax=Metabacillus hrfriensis TaxID=3048891 RepID=A0ACD4RA84_9BACI|nr:lysozyme family protein [Metabacillus sp. CT-WN-B3]UOK57673.1 lysozyme family protein [Bacillus sp. OVS6]USK28158.1 lysozyme family protein [Bacillus sp. CMF21]WHZ57364.1 lysozyme family protein [Metabacillus sp. CT-WN-B3]
MIKFLKNSIGFLLVVFFGFFILTILYSEETKQPAFYPSDAFENVKKYEPLISKELAEYQLEEYTPLVLALMQQESKGVGGDPMQASESAGLPRNTIEDPAKSIEQGVKYFQKSLQYGKERNVDELTVIQAYNMGTGYIDFIVKNGGKHSEDLAKEFSMIQVKKQPDIYNCGGDKGNFRYPYCYGDFTYSTKVQKNMNSLTETASAKKNDQM